MVLLTLLTLASFYAIFLLGYVPKKKKQFIQNHFHALEQLATNIKNKYRDEHKRRESDSTQKVKEEGVDSVTLQTAVEWVLDDPHNVFDELLVHDKNTIVFQSAANLSVSDCLNPKISSLDYQDGYLAGNLRQIKIAEVAYQSFNLRFALDGHSDIDYVLVGLTRSDSLQRHTRRLDRWTMTHIGLGLLLLLMSMPWIKLLSMNAIERLYRSNVIWLGIASLFGTAMITLVALSTYGEYQRKKAIEYRLAVLSDTVTAQFVKEIDKKLDILGVYERTEFSPQADGKIVGYPGGDTQAQRDSFVIGNRAKATRTAATYEDFGVLWIDSSGTIKLHVAAAEQVNNNQDSINISGRQYFRKALDGDLWYLERDQGKAFVLQSIRSWDDGQHEAVLSKQITDSSGLNPSNPSRVIALTSQFESVMDVKLLTGYSFAIVDGDGKVWFHSDMRRNLQENLLVSTGQNRKLRSALWGRRATTFSTRYLGGDVRMRISPLSDLPLYLAVSYDQALIEDYISEVITMVLVLIAILIGIVSLHIVLLFFCRHQSSKLRKQRFLLHFLAPNRHTVDRIPVINWTLLGTLLLLVGISGLTYYFPVLLGLEQSPFPLLMITSTLLCLGVFLYYHLEHQSHGKAKLNFFLISLALVLSLDLLYWVWFKVHVCPLIFTQVLLAGLLIVIPKVIKNHVRLKEPRTNGLVLTQERPAGPNDDGEKINKITGKAREGVSGSPESSVEPYKGKVRESRSVMREYSTMYTLLLLIFSVCAVQYSYKYSIADKRLQWIKYTQLESAQSPRQNFSAKANLIGVVTPEKEIPDIARPLDEYRYGKRHNIDGIRIVRDWHLGWFTNTDPTTMEVNALVDESAADTSFRWTATADNVYLEYLPPGKLDTIRLSTMWGAFGDTGKRASWFWTILVFGLVLTVLILALHYVMRFTVRRIFAEPFRNFSGAMRFCKKALDSSAYRRIFLIDMPDSEADAILDDHLQRLRESGGKYVRVDLQQVVEDVSSVDLSTFAEKDLIVVDNFESQVNNHQAWEAKLQVLLKLDRYTDKKMIIKSRIHPLLHLQFYQTMIEKSDSQQWNDKFREEYQSYRHAKTKWKQLFAKFVKLYSPLPTSHGQEPPSDMAFDTQKEERSEKIGRESWWKEFLARLLGLDLQSPSSNALKLEEELCRNQYLQGLKELVKANEGNTEDVILEIQSLAEPYYYAIWSNLSKREKFFIYDLATDGFANSKDGETVRMLLQKGLIRYENNLVLMNQSFNNFVLSIVDRKLDRAMRKEMLHQGTWSSLQIVLVLLLVGIGAFVVLEQKQILSNFQATLTALVALGGVLIRFSGLWGSLATRPESP